VLPHRLETSVLFRAYENPPGHARETRRLEVRALVDDYVSRIRRFAEVELTELREDSAAQLRRGKLTLDPAATVVLLDDTGKLSDLGAICQVAWGDARPRRS